MQELKENLKRQIVEQLNLKDINPESIGDDQPLFNEGLGLDSIDALELIVLLQRHYGIVVSKPDEGPMIFQSITKMAEYIQANRKN